MNELGVSLMWCAAQATVVGAWGGLLYLAARRIGSTIGSVIALSTLVLIVALTGLAASPWPRWWNAAERLSSTAPDSVAASGGPTEASAVGEVATTGNWLATASDYFQAFEDELRRTPTAQHRSGWRWPSAIAALFLTGTGIGLARLLLGLRAIHVLRGRCPLVADSALRELTDLLQAQIGCARKIELRESQRLGTAATVGWLRPWIVVPAGWRQWTEAERTAVLAHEIAHIHRNDFLSSLVAQIGLVLHFYHPLLHWLAGRLRLEQELAADAQAARLVGGARPYLTTLASMALRQDECPPGWPARTFLPTRGAFLRRIEMLRDHPQLVTNPSIARRLAMVGLLVAVALFAAGLRAPGQPDARTAFAQQAAKPAANEADQPAADDRIELSYVPGEASIVIAIRPAKLLRDPATRALAETMNEQFNSSKTLGLPIEEIEQITMVALRSGPQAGAPPQPPQPRGQIYRAVRPHDWAALAAETVPDPVEVRYAGQTYYKSRTRPDGLCFYRPDDRTIIFDEESSLYRYILRGQGLPGEFPWSNIWDQVSGGVAAAAIDVGAVRGAFTDEVQRQPQAAPFAAFAPLWEETTAIVAGAAIAERMHASIVIASPTNESREKVAATSQALLTLAGNIVRNTRQQAAAAPGPDGAAIVPLLDIGTELLTNAKIEQTEDNVTITATSRPAAVQLVATLAPALGAAREAARRAQAMNNLKQLALAMHNYAAVYGSFPPAVLYSPSNVPYSWRVAVLPYVEQEALYRQYNFDEPWDSEQNRKVLDQMPAVFRDAGADADSKNSSYFVLNGPEAIFGDRTGTGFAQILDGTSNTILMVEALRDIPWTKPEDVPYAANQPLPQLGGLRAGGFNAALADGSVRFISQAVAEATLRALISKAGGEVVELNP